MSKMIKVTDEVGAELERWAREDNTTLAGEIKVLLERKGGGDLKEYLEAKLSALESLIKDTTVDRLDRSFSRPKYETEIDWPIMKELIYDVLGYEDDSWASRAAAEGITESNDLEETRFILSDNFICVDKGKKIPIIKLTPKVKTFLESKGVIQ